MHPNLRRLDRLAAHLADDPCVEAVLGLGSAGVEPDRFDDHSDIDFFVITDSTETKHGYLQDISWLQGFGSRVAYSFVNDPDGRKVLLSDGLFLEYAIFTPAELAVVPYAGARVVWSRGLRCDGRRRCRELRGEHLSAMRLIQVHAVDQVLAMVRLDRQTRLDHPDLFDATRRIEQAGISTSLPLDQMVPGYTRNVDAARAVLAWLTAHHEADPVIVAAIAELAATPETATKTDVP